MPSPLGGSLPHHPCQHQLLPWGPATDPRMTPLGEPFPPSLQFPSGVPPISFSDGHHQGPLWIGVIVGGAHLWDGVHWGRLKSHLSLQGLYLGVGGAPGPHGHVLPYVTVGGLIQSLRGSSYQTMAVVRGHIAAIISEPDQNVRTVSVSKSHSTPS